MKELSIEQKAQRYDEALHKAKRIIDVCVDDNTECRSMIACIQQIFPELRESEDKRIRKDIVTYLKSAINNKGYRDKVIESWVAWLEKQAQKPNPCDGCINRKGCINCENGELRETEQEPTDKVETKFHEGEWVVSPNGVYWHIDKISNNRYEVTANTGESSDWPLDTNIYHRFTIQDAKDGDVIYSKHNTESFEWIGIFKSLDKENKRVFFYGFWNNMAKSFSVSRNEAFVLYDDFSPATKEHREQLEKAMADAGYEWDAEQKQLKKIEKKPAKWSEEDDLALAIQNAIDEYCECGCNNLFITEQKYDFGYEIKLSIKKVKYDT